MTDKVDYIIDILYIVYNLLLIEYKSLEDN